MIDLCTVCNERMLPEQSCLHDRHKNCPKPQQPEPEFPPEMVECAVDAVVDADRCGSMTPAVYVLRALRSVVGTGVGAAVLHPLPLLFKP